MMGSALTSAGFEAELTGTGPFTVFAANDDVFGDALKSLGTTKLELLNLPALPTILKNHVVKGSVLAADLKEGSEIETLGGTKVTGTPAQIKDVEKKYRVYAEKKPLAGGNYGMDHSSVLYLMGPDGRLVTYYDEAISPDNLAKELKQKI